MPSSLEWGSCITGTNHFAAGVWNKYVSFQHSNYRELLAVLMTILSFKNQLKGRRVQILSDNVTTVAYINHLGGASQDLSDLMTTMWASAQQINVTLSAKHLSGVVKETADGLSRLESPYEWRLHPSLFRMINADMGPAHSRSVCKSNDKTVAKVQFSTCGPRDRGSGCISSEQLVRGDELLQSTVLDVKQSDCKSLPNSVRGNSNSTMVVRERLVQQVGENVSGPTDKIAKQSKSSTKGICET